MLGTQAMGRCGWKPTPGANLSSPSRVQALPPDGDIFRRLHCGAETPVSGKQIDPARDYLIFVHTVNN